MGKLAYCQQDEQHFNSSHNFLHFRRNCCAIGLRSVLFLIVAAAPPGFVCFSEALVKIDVVERASRIALYTLEKGKPNVINMLHVI